MFEAKDRRAFLTQFKWALLTAWAAGVNGISTWASPLQRVAAKKVVKKVVPIRSLSLNGYVFRPGTKRKRETCEEDVVICVEQDIVIQCTAACDGCDRCNSNCNSCNGCNSCDHACDPGCNTCNGCNACNRCDLCNAACNTCNQCDHSGDLCVRACDNSCDGCNASNTCGVDINRNAKNDKEEIAALENSIKAMERTLDKKRQVLAKLRR